MKESKHTLDYHDLKKQNKYASLDSKELKIGIYSHNMLFLLQILIKMKNTTKKHVVN